MMTHKSPYLKGLLMAWEHSPQWHWKFMNRYLNHLGVRVENPTQEKVIAESYRVLVTEGLIESI